ncbi:OLC1v1004872C1 [Oldenlandia corymbosa var. corymbosa]|uniref:OLC1v1004872C1 n=1 Tax=Oldenlandia corymbosa var. corymbosa TaxID=529605 RepID=A0AAV1DFR1_OLDCO|nr:OLC1v1004872C1 [Oldenlandia corymbosa var. corymbosa]
MMMMNTLRTGSRSANQLLKQTTSSQRLLLPPPSSATAVRHFFSRRRDGSEGSYVIHTPFAWPIHMVPEKRAYVIERFGKYLKTMEPGLNFLIPFVDRVSYVQSLKDTTIPISQQSAITKDNVFLSIDGVLYVKIVDPKLASYGVEDPIFAVIQLAQTTMRGELGKISLDKSFEERDSLNEKIVLAINEAAKGWGLKCLRYEIKDISPPKDIKVVMEMQVEAERKKRAQILEAEGLRQATILASEAARLDQLFYTFYHGNEDTMSKFDCFIISDDLDYLFLIGLRQATILASEAAKLDQINRAEGLKQATILASEGNYNVREAEAISIVAAALKKNGGFEAASLRVAEQYFSAFAKIAQESTTMLLPANATDPASMVTQSLALYKRLIVDKQNLGHDALLEDLKSAPTSSSESSSMEIIE